MCGLSQRFATWGLRIPGVCVSLGIRELVSFQNFSKLKHLTFSNFFDYQKVENHYFMYVNLAIIFVLLNLSEVLFNFKAPFISQHQLHQFFN